MLPQPRLRAPCGMRARRNNEMFDRMQSVLLIGQSNMVGVGLKTTVDPIDDDRLFMMRGDEWVKMKEPLHTNTSRAGIGLGASFGKAFVDTFGCDVGLIPAAKGSTRLDNWAVGGDLYNEAVRLARLAGETSEVAAILWHQGEGDQSNENYAELLRVILDAMIADIGLDPDKIVIITGKLFGTRSDAVHMGQLTELGKHYKNYGIADSNGLTVLDVTTHFDAPSLRVFGYRYFAIFYKLVTGKTFEYDDNPEHYWSSQIGSAECVYLPFDDMLTGNGCTGYSGNGYLVVSGKKGDALVRYNKNGDTSDRFLEVSNSLSLADGVSADSRNNVRALGYGGVVCIECKIRLGQGREDTYSANMTHSASASILDVHTENSSAIYSSLYLDASGILSTVDADGNKTNEIALNTTDWVSVKVILDTERNLKDVYVNDRIALGGVRISNEVDPSTLTIDFTRLVEILPESEATVGFVQINDYRFYPYFDNLHPAE